MKKLSALIVSFFALPTFAKLTTADCREPYSYYGGYYLTAELKDQGPAVVSYGREHGPDGDGEVIEEQTFSAQLKPAVRPNTALLALANGNELEFNFELRSAKLSLPQEDISLDCVFTEK